VLLPANGGCEASYSAAQYVLSGEINVGSISSQPVKLLEEKMTRKMWRNLSRRLEMAEAKKSWRLWRSGRRRLAACEALANQRG